MLTVNGRIAVASPDLNPLRIVGLGLALAGEAGLEPPGPFRLELAWIKAARRAGGVLGEKPALRMPSSGG